jgi:predicted DNA-binding transcriptional regulator AlpA
MGTQDVDRLMDEKEAATMLGMQRQTLAKWRMNGNPDAPPFVRVGRSCRYKLSTIQAWILAQDELTCSARMGERG